MFAGQNGYPTSTGNTSNKISPRGGFAYQLNANTVIRGGAGLFYSGYRVFAIRLVLFPRISHAASVFSTSLIQYDVPNTIASSLKL